MAPHKPGTADARTGVPSLSGEIQRVLARVDAHAQRATRPERSPAATESSPNTAPVPVPDTTTLDALVTCFGLTAFERDVVLLTAAQELEPTTAARCAAACGDPQRAHPTFSLALAALAEPHWSALTPVAPLRRWRIAEPDDASGLTTSRLRL